jgi:hypothetical protein
VTDLRSALSRVAPPVAADPRAADADLARGRSALRRRRTARGAGALVLVTAAAGVVRNAGPVADRAPSAAPTTAAPATTTPGPAPTTPTVSAAGVRLVAFNGSQPSGYQVAYVPKGWEIQAAYPLAMVIAPIGFPDREQYSFEGKLVVMLRSSSDTGDPAGTPVKVGKGTGYANHNAGGGVTVLTYRDTRGNWVQVQAPSTLGWSDAELARFAEGVVVTGNAVAGLG